MLRNGLSGSQKTAPVEPERARRRSWRVALLVVFPAAGALADSWGPPRAEHWSANRRYVLKVGWGLAPGADTLSLWHETPEGSKPIWNRGYVDEHCPPLEAYVADDGRHVVLRDLHGEVGSRKVLVFLGPSGEVMRAYELEDILTRHEILFAKHTVSSLWWSEHGWFALRDHDRQFVFITKKGTIGCFETASGDRIDLKDEDRAAIIREAIPHARKLLSDGDPQERERGATLLGVLDSKGDTPVLEGALDDPGITGTVSTCLFRFHDEYGVQLAAARSLVHLIGPDAMPLIENKLPTANSYMRQAFLRIMATLDSDEDHLIPIESAYTKTGVQMWERLTQHEMKDIRDFALDQRLLRDDGSFVRRHPELLERWNGWSGDIRRHAFGIFANSSTDDDIPRLRQALNDRDHSVRSDAFEALIRLNVPDSPQLLAWGMEQQAPSTRGFAMKELARRGDEAAIAEVVGQLDAAKDHSHQDQPWCRDGGIGSLCRLVAELKLAAAKPTLREMLPNECPHITREVSGALAALGDSSVLPTLRQYAEQGDVWDRREAIEWLGRVKDQGAEALLQNALHDREPWVREAASEALAKLQPHESRQTSPSD